tara:strand:- start:82 stop:261 length:180 start_codon:yes stop_codon:yes gene_type:complete
VRNLKQENGFLFLPTLLCLKKIGPLEFAFIRQAIKTNIGIKITTKKEAKVKSHNLLKNL